MPKMKNTLTFERESKTLEFKSRLPSFSHLIKTCIAFANGIGGKIIIGVDDKTKKLIGVSDVERDRLYDDFPNSLFDSTSPPLIAQIYEKRFNDLSVLIVEIPISPKKPYFLKNEGIPKGVYIRIGSSTRKASPEYIEDLIRESSRISFDGEILQVDRENLSKDLIKEFYGKQVSIKRMLTDKIIATSPANRDKYCSTVAGVLFFYENPQDFVPEATVICTRFKGDSGRNIIQTEELSGPIGRLVESTFQLVSSWMEKDFKLLGTRLRGNIPIPREALREAIINGLIHRKYSIPGPVKIALFDHHLEIFNPGSFPGLVDLENLGDGITYLRNPHIARIAHKMGLVEKLGSGIRLIFDSCRKAKIKPPHYQEGGDFVKITFYFEPARLAKQSGEETILSLVKMRGEISIREVMRLLEVSRNTATRKLNNLIRQKKIIRIGKGPSVVFTTS